MSSTPGRYALVFGAALALAVVCADAAAAVKDARAAEAERFPREQRDVHERPEAAMRERPDEGEVARAESREEHRDVNAPAEARAAAVPGDDDDRRSRALDGDRDRDRDHDGDRDRRRDRDGDHDHDVDHDHDRDHDFDRDGDHDWRGWRPGHYREVHWHGDPWYFDGRWWYRPDRGRWIVTRPPIGFVVTFLPDEYATIWLGGVPYYFADGVYYAWRPLERDYVVVAPPVGVASPPPATAFDEVYAYPLQNQDEATQENDRYECHRWALERTGFDPTVPNGGVSPESARTRHDAYVRAETACLTARGYSAR